jgi:hypothetical protein
MESNNQETTVRRTFQLGKDSEVKQRDSTVSLSFKVAEEEMAINFKPDHLDKLKEIVKRLQRIERKNAKAKVIKKGGLTIAIDF